MFPRQLQLTLISQKRGTTKAWRVGKKMAHDTFKYSVIIKRPLQQANNLKNRVQAHSRWHRRDVFDPTNSRHLTNIVLRIACHFGVVKKKKRTLAEQASTCDCYSNYARPLHLNEKLPGNKRWRLKTEVLHKFHAACAGGLSFFFFFHLNVHSLKQLDPLEN
jgi:hypothetical protein